MRAGLMIFVTVMLTACGGLGASRSGDGSSEAPQSSPEGAWVLTSADPPIEVPDDARVTLNVAPEEDHWRVSGTAACNSYSGGVRTDGDTWTFGDGVAVTEMACSEPLMTIEQQFLDALLAVDTWSRSGDVLVLQGSDVELTFELLPPVPTAELTGTTWQLDGLVSGEGDDAGVSSTVAGADDATLRLDPDGSVDASTGCRTFSGTWVEEGDEIRFDSFGVRDDSPNQAPDGTTTCSDAVVAQEDHVLSVLGDRFRAEVDGQQLTLTSRDGLGLVYRAAGEQATPG